MKLTQVPRDISTVRAILRKSINVYGFLKTATIYNLRIVHQSKRILTELADQGLTEVSLYGSGEIAELLYGLSFEVPIGIRSIYGDFGDETFRGTSVSPIDTGVHSSEKIIIAAVVGVDDKITRLMRLGIEPQRIVSLR